MIKLLENIPSPTVAERYHMLFNHDHFIERFHLWNCEWYPYDEESRIIQPFSIAGNNIQRYFSGIKLTRTFNNKWSDLTIVDDGFRSSIIFTENETIFSSIDGSTEIFHTAVPYFSESDKRYYQWYHWRNRATLFANMANGAESIYRGDFNWPTIPTSLCIQSLKLLLTLIPSDGRGTFVIKYSKDNENKCGTISIENLIGRDEYEYDCISITSNGNIRVDINGSYAEEFSLSQLIDAMTNQELRNRIKSNLPCGWSKEDS